MASPEAGKIETQQGLLPHEAAYVRVALRKARVVSAQAELNYGEAVASSGGDWAFDDPASASAAAEAHHRELDVKTLDRLATLSKDVPALEYPKEDDPHVQVGSRVRLAMGGFEDEYDIVSHRIPGMQPPQDIELVSVHSPLGRVVLGACVGDQISWPVGERTIAADVTGLDQLAQQAYYPLALQELQES
jgi:transcription elongation GreA/GreB family factor